MTIEGRIHGGAGAALLLAALVAVGCGAPQGDDDCAEAKRVWGPSGNLGSASLGDTCASGSYGSCKQSYSNCIEGVCKYLDSANDDVCTLGCETSSDCGGWYCKDGYCAPACAAHTYCDGYTCCYYAPSPSDPTVCYQVHC